MKFVALVAVGAALFADVFGSKSSVGGPMTDLLVSFIVMITVGVYEAWGRDLIWWIVCVVLAIIGGCIGIWLMSIALETTMTFVHFEGKLASSNHPLRYIADVAMPLFTVLGAWLPIDLVNRARQFSSSSTRPR